MSVIHPKDIAVLCKIINPDGKHILVLTTEKAFFQQQANTELLDCTIDFFTNKETLIQAIENQPSTILNLTNQQINITQKSIDSVAIIQFSKPTSHHSDHFAFDFINNTDKTIRWIYPSEQSDPSFLHLYNGSGKRGWIFSTIFRLGFKLGLKNVLKSGRFWVLYSTVPILEKKPTPDNANIAVFTGTKGSNRKAVVAYSNANQPIQFVKMPLATPAYNLIQKEGYYLKKLQPYHFKYLQVPIGTLHASSLTLTNIKPDQPLENETLSYVHLCALEELYQATLEYHALDKLEVWAAIKNDITSLKFVKIENDLSKDKVQHIWLLLHQLYQTLDHKKNIPTSIAHGDFTPWNSYASTTKIHVYDWELADRLPLLYDAFHFIIQTGVLVHHLDHEAIWIQLATMVKHPKIKEMELAFQLDVEHAFQFYLLRNTSYYMARYVRQTHLHEQAHWLLNVWLKILEYSVTQTSNAKISAT